MWPWEHLAFGYVLYSGYTRLRHGRRPERGPVIALAVATQLPDLIDKPLAWTFDVLPTARSLGHSVFVAGVFLGVVALLMRRRGVPAVGPAVAVGYLSHLLGDVFYHVVTRVLGGGEIAVGDVAFLLWPLVRQSSRETGGLLGRTDQLFGEFVTYLGTPDGLVYLALELGLLLLATAFWASDGWPGLSMDR
jgi:xanthosine utilization system XapX-like protein